jgi:electron-transferring-flavoprotein dehydrogenase
MLRHGAQGAAKRLNRQLDKALHIQERSLSTSTCIASTSYISSSLSRPRSSLQASTSRLIQPLPLSCSLSTTARRSLATHTDDPPSTEEDAFDLSTVERVSDEVDVCIVGGGPAGLSAAIRLMQLAKEQGNEEFRVVVLEKGGEVGEFLHYFLVYYCFMLTTISY